MKLTKKKIIITLLLIIILVFVYFIYKHTINYYNIKDRKTNIKKFEFVDKEKAKGWIRIQGTNIDMPIMDHDEVSDVSDPTYNIGWFFNEYDPQLNRVVIYSHNMRNVSSHPLITNKKHERFEQLMSFIYYSFAKKNLYIQYSTEKENNLYKIYAVYLINKSEFLDSEEFESKNKNKYINNAKKKSYFKYDIDVNEKDNLLTLNTCTRFYKNDSYSFIVEARKVRKDEKINKYKVKVNKSYDKVLKILKGDE